MKELLKDFVIAVTSLEMGAPIDGGVRYRGNFDQRSDDEIVNLSSVQVRDAYRNNVRVYRKKGGKGRYMLETSFGNKEVYSLGGEFTWNGEKIDRSKISDFDKDGFVDAVFYNSSSAKGMMLTYDRATDQFLLVPVKVMSNNLARSRE